MVPPKHGEVGERVDRYDVAASAEAEHKAIIRRACNPFGLLFSSNPHSIEPS
jgi:hypothetical protein